MRIILAESDPKLLIQRACANLAETPGYHNAWIALMDDKGESVT